MAMIPGKGERSFKTNIETLLDELSLAFQWQRPSLLLTVHKSKIDQEKAQESLAKNLKLAGHPVVNVQIEESNPDTASRILQTQPADQYVFFVSGLDRGGGPDGMDAYRALNLGRESFVDNRLKVVFWLTVSEAVNITRRAPDFWAFRHRVIEFASSAPHLSGDQLTSLLMWHGADTPPSPAELADKIKDQQRLLSELPNTPDSLALRIETCYLIGRAYWAAGDGDRALKNLMAGIGLAQEKDFAHLTAWLLGGVSIIKHARGRYQEALEIIQDLVRHDQDDGILNMNLAIALCSVGKNYEGLSQGNRTVNKKNADPRLLNSLAHLFLLLGKLDEAVSIFEKAVKLLPRRATAHESLAVCYFRMGLAEEALAEIRAARQYADEPYDRQAIFEQAILGNTGRSISLLENAITQAHVSISIIRYDPNINSIIDVALIAKAT